MAGKLLSDSTQSGPKVDKDYLETQNKNEITKEKKTYKNQLSNCQSKFIPMIQQQNNHTFTTYIKSVLTS